MQETQNLEELESQVRALIAQGRRIEAVKRVRETTGWGLKQSKDYADALAQPEAGPNDPCPCGSGRKYKHCCGRKH